MCGTTTCLSAPKLLTIRQDGRRREVVAQPTKHGFLFVFDRVTGEPIWPIEERPVPQSDVPGERTWPDAAGADAAGPLARQTFTEQDINPYLPEAERRDIRERLRSYRNDGLFTPPSFRGLIEMPGHSGGTNWGGVAVDPDAGELYVRSMALPTLLRLHLPGTSEAGASRTGPATIISADEATRLTRQANEALRTGPLRLTSPYDFMFSSTYLSPIGPPWSEIVAYDLNTGDNQVACAARCGDRAGDAGDSIRQWCALAARRSAGHRRWAALRRIRVRQDAARLRSPDGRGGLDVPVARGVRRGAGLLRGRWAAIHRVAGRRWPRLESGALSHASAGAGQRLHRVRIGRSKMAGMPRTARVVTWNGKDVPTELRELPAGRYVVEAIDEDAPALSPEEEAGIEAALESYRQGRVVDAKRARQIIDTALGR